MKQLEKASEKYALDFQNEEGYPLPTYNSYDAKEMRECAFMAGALWQSEQSSWISVNERLPKENTGVFFVVEWKDLHKGYFVGLYYGNGQWESDHRIFLPDSLLGRITHWMPIPKINE